MYAQVDERQFTDCVDAVSERLENGQDPEKAIAAVVDQVANSLHAFLTHRFQVED